MLTFLGNGATFGTMGQLMQLNFDYTLKISEEYFVQYRGDFGAIICL